MSLLYDKYLNDHVSCVWDAFNWITINLSAEDISKILSEIQLNELKLQISLHDQSKKSDEEYDAYDKYFYSEKTEEVKKNFDRAWLHHQHHNPHHWQYWILKEDDGPVVSNDTMRVKAIDIPDRYIMEMLCDWWSFSWKKYKASHNKQDLYEVFEWYDSHKDGMILHPDTLTKVTKMLELIWNSLDAIPNDIGIFPITV